MKFALDLLNERDASLCLHQPEARQRRPIRLEDHVNRLKFLNGQPCSALLSFPGFCLSH